MSSQELHPVALRLLELAEKVPVPLPEVTDDDLLQVEETLLLPLPRPYREFLLQTGHIVYGSIEPAVASDPYAHNYIAELTPIAWEQGLPRDRIVIAECEGGYYVISQLGEIQFWQQGQFSEEIYEDIWQWAAEVWLQGNL